jgi:esterase
LATQPTQFQIRRFHHQISGNPSGHKLVFLHGLMGSLSNWRRIVTAFEADYQILVFDQRGHGRSFQPESGYAPSDFAADLKGILDHYGWRKIDLVGHSMGGRNALEFANHWPERIEKLVIEDIGPEQGIEGLQIIERMLNLVPTPFASRFDAKQFFETKFENLISFHDQPHVIRQFFYTNLEEKPDGRTDWRFSKRGILETLQIGHTGSRWNLVENLTIPTLWIHGEQSRDLTRSMFEEILRRNPKIKGVEVAGSGHWVHFDQPEAFIAALKDFLTLGS